MADKLSGGLKTNKGDKMSIEKQEARRKIADILNGYPDEKLIEFASKLEQSQEAGQLETLCYVYGCCY